LGIDFQKLNKGVWDTITILKTLNSGLIFSSCHTWKYTFFRHQWLTPVILPTREAEVRRVTVPSQLTQIVHETLSQKIHHKKMADGMVKWW
jgi:hypothetical protein